MNASTRSTSWLLWGLGLVVGLVVLGWILKRIVLLGILAVIAFVIWTAIQRLLGHQRVRTQRATEDDFERRMRELDQAEAALSRHYEEMDR